MSFNPTIAYGLSRLEGFTSSQYKIVPNSTTAVANQEITFTLPKSSLVDMRSFAVKFKLALSGTGKVRVGNLKNIFSRVSVSIGGIEVNSGSNNINLLSHIKRVLREEVEDPVLGHTEIIRNGLSYHTGTAVGVKEDDATYIIDDFEGFLNSVEPRVLNLALLPSVVISLTVSPDAAITTNALNDDTGANFILPAASQDGSVVLTEIAAYVVVNSMNNEVYNEILENAMDDKGVIEVPYKNYQEHSATANSVNFYSNSASVDRLWVATRDIDYQTTRKNIGVRGYGGSEATDLSFNSKFDYDNEKYVSSYFNMPEPDAAMKAQWVLNSATLPNFQMDFHEQYALTKNSVPFPFQKKHGMATMRKNFNAACVQLNMDGAEKIRSLSGLDTRGISLQGQYNLTGVSSPKVVSVFVESTAVLQIGQNLQLAIIP
jgi:hypothetical protein